MKCEQYFVAIPKPEASKNRVIQIQMKADIICHPFKYNASTKNIIVVLIRFTNSKKTNQLSNEPHGNVILVMKHCFGNIVTT